MKRTRYSEEQIIGILTELRPRLRGLANERHRFGYQTPKAFAEHLTTATDSRAAPSEGSARMSVAHTAPHGASPQGA